MTDKQTLFEYYNKKAEEYEEVYRRNDPQRLKEQEIIKQYIIDHFKGREVLELACGTGYWTEYLVTVAKHVVAIDQSEEMLAIARNKLAEKTNITFEKRDAYDPPKKTPEFTGCMANFLLSHIPRKELDGFLETVHSRLSNDAFVMLVDSNYQEGKGGLLVKQEGKDDTWKRRKLNNGEEYDVLKNYFTKQELENIFQKYTDKLELHYLTNFWIVGYHFKK